MNCFQKQIVTNTLNSYQLWRIKLACVTKLECPFLEIANYLSFLKQKLLNNKIPGSSTAADSPLANSIRPKRQGRQVHLISLYLYNNSATIYFAHQSQQTYSQYRYHLTTGLVFVSQYHGSSMKNLITRTRGFTKKQKIERITLKGGLGSQQI